MQQDKNGCPHSHILVSKEQSAALRTPLVEQSTGIASSQLVHDAVKALHLPLPPRISNVQGPVLQLQPVQGDSQALDITMLTSFRAHFDPSTGQPLHSQAPFAFSSTPGHAFPPAWEDQLHNQQEHTTHAHLMCQQQQHLPQITGPSLSRVHSAPIPHALIKQQQQQQQQCQQQCLHQWQQQQQWWPQPPFVLLHDARTGHCQQVPASKAPHVVIESDSNSGSQHHHNCHPSPHTHPHTHDNHHHQHHHHQQHQQYHQHSKGQQGPHNDPQPQPQWGGGLGDGPLYSTAACGGAHTHAAFCNHGSYPNHCDKNGDTGTAAAAALAAAAVGEGGCSECARAQQGQGSGSSDTNAGVVETKGVTKRPAALRTPPPVFFSPFAPAAYAEPPPPSQPASRMDPRMQQPDPGGAVLHHAHTLAQQQQQQQQQQEGLQQGEWRAPSAELDERIVRALSHQYQQQQQQYQQKLNRQECGSPAPAAELPCAPAAPQQKQMSHAASPFAAGCYQVPWSLEHRAIAAALAAAMACEQQQQNGGQGVAPRAAAAGPTQQAGVEPPTTTHPNKVSEARRGSPPLTAPPPCPTIGNGNAHARSGSLASGVGSVHSGACVQGGFEEGGFEDCAGVGAGARGSGDAGGAGARAAAAGGSNSAAGGGGDEDAGAHSVAPPRVGGSGSAARANSGSARACGESSVRRLDSGGQVQGGINVNGCAGSAQRKQEGSGPQRELSMVCGLTAEGAGLHVRGSRARSGGGELNGREEVSSSRRGRDKEKEGEREQVVRGLNGVEHVSQGGDNTQAQEDVADKGSDGSRGSAGSASPCAEEQHPTPRQAAHAREHERECERARAQLCNGGVGGHARVAREQPRAPTGGVCGVGTQSASAAAGNAGGAGCVRAHGENGSGGSRSGGGSKSVQQGSSGGRAAGCVVGGGRGEQGCGSRQHGQSNKRGSKRSNEEKDSSEGVAVDCAGRQQEQLNNPMNVIPLRMHYCEQLAAATDAARAGHIEAAVVELERTQKALDAAAHVPCSAIMQSCQALPYEQQQQQQQRQQQPREQQQLQPVHPQAGWWPPQHHLRQLHHPGQVQLLPPGRSGRREQGQSESPPLPGAAIQAIARVGSRTPGLEVGHAGVPSSEWELDGMHVQYGKRIAVGGFAEVFAGRYLGTLVAIKKLLATDPDAVRHFAHEVRVLARLRHPNLILFIGYCLRPEPAILYEFMPRGSLFNIMRQHKGPLEPRLQRAVAGCVARGMAYLHSRNPPILHLDLKSPNILVDAQWRIKVCDFGLSAVRRQAFLSSACAGGTPEWMAPEMLRCEDYNEKADVWSFGVVLWELLTGEVPFVDLSPMQVVGMVGFKRQGLSPPEQGDSTLQHLCGTCMTQDPLLRPSFTTILDIMDRAYHPNNYAAGAFAAPHSSFGNGRAMHANGHAGCTATAPPHTQQQQQQECVRPIAQRPPRLMIAGGAAESSGEGAHARTQGEGQQGVHVESGEQGTAAAAASPAAAPAGSGEGGVHGGSGGDDGHSSAAAAAAAAARARASPFAASSYGLAPQQEQQEQQEQQVQQVQGGVSAVREGSPPSKIRRLKDGCG